MATALLLVDVQRNLLEPPRPVPDGEQVRGTIQSVLNHARRSGAMVVHILNDGPPGSPDAPGTPGWVAAFPALDDEPVFHKTEDDAFTLPELVRHLARGGIDRLVIAGLLSDHCVAATCRGALRRGYKVFLVSGAHATYPENGSSAETIAARVERSLFQEGVRVTPPSRVIFRH
ncbi:MAG TPA: isochorismatase family protein [Thermoplasmata archaeon]|nr:isochorismatase family protein [Thermoplasmata archaeon]